MIDFPKRGGGHFKLFNFLQEVVFGCQRTNYNCITSYNVYVMAVKNLSLTFYIYSAFKTKTAYYFFCIFTCLLIINFLKKNNGSAKTYFCWYLQLPNCHSTFIFLAGIWIRDLPSSKKCANHWAMTTLELELE